MLKFSFGCSFLFLNRRTCFVHWWIWLLLWSSIFKKKSENIVSSLISCNEILQMDFHSVSRSKVNSPAEFFLYSNVCFEKVLIAVLITHGYRVVDGVLHSSSQALLHHAGELVEFMLLVDFKHTQQLPALLQASPDLHLHRPRAAARPCHLHLLQLGVQMQNIIFYYYFRGLHSTGSVQYHNALV